MTPNGLRIYTLWLYYCLLGSGWVVYAAYDWKHDKPRWYSLFDLALSAWMFWCASDYKRQMQKLDY